MGNVGGEKQFVVCGGGMAGRQSVESNAGKTLCDMRLRFSGEGDINEG